MLIILYTKLKYIPKFTIYLSVLFYIIYYMYVIVNMIM